MSKRLSLFALAATAWIAVSPPTNADAGYGHGYSGHYGHGYSSHYGHGYSGHYGHGYSGHYGHGYSGDYGHGYSDPYYAYPEEYGIQVKAYPKPLREDMQVYVNGAYVGVVDDFDGFFQSLSLAPGQYDIEVRLEGYRTFRQRILVGRGYADRIRFEMEPLTADEQDTGADASNRQESSPASSR